MAPVYHPDIMLAELRRKLKSTCSVVTEHNALASVWMSAQVNFGVCPEWR